MFTFLAANWVIFEIVAVVLYAMAFVLQFRNTKVMLTSESVVDVFVETLKRFGFVVHARGACMGAGVIGLTVKLIEYSQTTGAA